MLRVVEVESGVAGRASAHGKIQFSVQFAQLKATSRPFSLLSALVIHLDFQEELKALALIPDGNRC
jgi:hypothetical protein